MAQRKKIKQGQSRWVVWVYQTVERTKPEQLVDFERSPLAGDVLPVSERQYHMERAEVLKVRGDQVTFKMGAMGNVSTWPLADFLKMPDTYRKARRQLQQAESRQP